MRERHSRSEQRGAGQISRKSLRAAVTCSIGPSGKIPSSLWNSELSQARIWPTRTSLSRSRPQVPAGIRTRKGNASALETLVVSGRTTVLSSPASPNSDGWIARQGRRLPCLIPTRGSRSTRESWTPTVHFTYDGCPHSPPERSLQDRRAFRTSRSSHLPAPHCPIGSLRQSRTPANTPVRSRCAPAQKLLRSRARHTEQAAHCRAGKAVFDAQGDRIT